MSDYILRQCEAAEEARGRDPRPLVNLTHAKTEAQPIAWALASGHCPVINSDTRPGLEHVATKDASGRWVGGLIGIHASLRRPATIPCECGCGVYRHDWPGRALGIQVPAALGFGALIGVARLVGVVRRSSQHERERLGYGEFRHILGRGGVTDEVPAADAALIRPWAPPNAKWLLFLRDAVLLPEPIPMRGAGGLWRLPRCMCGECEYDLPLRSPAVRALEQWRKARETR